MEIQDPTLKTEKKENDGIKIILVVMTAVAVILCLGCCFMLLTYAIISRAGTLDAVVQTKCPSPPETWQFYVTDTFDSDPTALDLKSGEHWPVQVVSNDYARTDWNFIDNTYRVLLSPKQATIQFMTRDTPVATDFYLAVDVKKVRGAMEDYYGVVFRQTHENYYFFAMSDTQEYVAWVHQSEWNNLIPWTSYDGIKPGEFNTLTVLAWGTDLTFCINDEIVSKITDDQRSKGYLGLLVGTEDTSDPAEFRFDNFKLWISP